MKKIPAFLAIIFSVTVIYAQINLVDTARDENSTMRSANSGFAEEDFRRGVQSYYRGAYNEAIIQFEKALSYLPGENLILDWLGKAYYRSGIEGAALQQWMYARDNNYGGILLQNRIEIVENRRITGLDTDINQRYTESGAYPGVIDKTLYFSQPISSLSNSDGSIWVVAYGTNELLRFDVNGFIVDRIRGPVNGFDRPMDIIRLQNGNLLITESAGDRLALLNSKGKFIKYIGEKGLGLGQLIGPQYAAEDSYGNIYVTDFGNNRVTVFDSEGNGLLTFGGKKGSFKGFKSPTGIAVIDDRIFVADSVLGGIYEFDRAGNYIGILVEDKTFARPECMKQYGNYLILTDSNRVIAVDSVSGAAYENARTSRSVTSITSAVPDKNGNIIVTDIKANEIYIMSKMTELVGGLFVQIERVIADNFPTVIVEARVENRNRIQVVGLKQENFFITEGKRPVVDMKLLGAANNNDVVDITLLIDRNLDMKKYEDQLSGAVKELTQNMNPGANIQIISIGEIPVIEYNGSPVKLSDFSAKSLKTAYTENPALDLGLRLAANNLINAEKKRGIIFLTAGTVSQNAFTKYGLSDISTYLNNNAVSMATVMMTQGSASSEIQYLTENTEGSLYYIYRPEGLGAVIKDIQDIPSGLYQLQYTSTLPTEYGRKYLPVEIETYLLNRSGRDESGYFAPLQ